MKSKNIAYFAAGAAALVGIGFWVKARFFPETLLQVATEVHGCIERGDGACLDRRMETGEKKATGVTRDGLDRFLNKVVKPSLAGFQPDPKMDIQPDQTSGELLAVRIYKHPDGRQCAIGVEVAMTEDGVRTINLLPTLVFARFEADKPAAPPKGKRNEPEEWVASLDKVMPEIRPTGIERIGPVGSRREFYTWEGWREHLNSEAARLRAERG